MKDLMILIKKKTFSRNFVERTIPGNNSTRNGGQPVCIEFENGSCYEAGFEKSASGL